MMKLFLSFFFITSLHAQTLEINQLFNKKLIKVKKESVGTVKSFYGKTQLNEENTIDIVTRYDGFITQLFANKSYMQIKKGQTLFSIYSNSVLSIQKELQVAKSINKNLYKSSLEKLIALGIEQKEITRIENSKQTLSSIRITSPINALVIKKNINNGSAVKKGQLLLQLSNIEQLWFVADVYQKDLSFVQPNMAAKIYVDGINKTFTSRVDYIYPIVNTATKTVKVRFVINNKNLELYPNMFAKVKLQNVKKEMLTLPKTAVLNKGSKYYVFKPLSQGEFEPIEVQVNRIASNKYEITDGVQANEEVINNALFLLDSDAVTNALYEEEDDDW